MINKMAKMVERMEGRMEGGKEGRNTCSSSEDIFSILTLVVFSFLILILVLVLFFVLLSLLVLVLFVVIGTVGVANIFCGGVAVLVGVEGLEVGC